MAIDQAKVEELKRRYRLPLYAPLFETERAPHPFLMKQIYEKYGF